MANPLNLGEPLVAHYTEHNAVVIHAIYLVFQIILPLIVEDFSITDLAAAQRARSN